MKDVILYLSISLILVCCSSKQDQDQNLFLFNDISFKLIDGEKVVNTDSKHKEIFHSYHDAKSTQIPLFKCLESDNYSIFIGVPFNTSLIELSNISMPPHLKLTLFEGDSINYVYKAYNSEKELVTIYAKNFMDNLVYVLTVSNSAELSDSLFNAKALSNRFNK